MSKILTSLCFVFLTGRLLAGDYSLEQSLTGYEAQVSESDMIQLGNTSVTSVATSGKLTTGTVTYPNSHGTDGQVLGTTGSGELVWVGTDDIIARHTQELEEQVASLQEQLQSQQEELLAIVQSQQEQIAQLQKMVEHQLAMN